MNNFDVGSDSFLCNPDGIWNGWWDEDKEGEMVSIATSPLYNIPKKLSDQDYSQWFVGEPNGKTLENCGVVSLNSLGIGGWFDVDCSRKFCSACDVPSIPDFVLRGWFKFVFIKNQND